VPKGRAQAIAALLAADPDIEYVEPDAMMYPVLVPNDTSYSDQWGYYGRGFSGCGVGAE
jgi:serine protease